MEPIRIQALMIEDNPGDARLIELALAEVTANRIDVHRVGRLADGLARLSQARFDLVLLDLSLPDSDGIETFEHLRAEHPDVPVVVLSGLSDERIAVAAVNQGAQDYLVKGSLDGGTLTRSILYAIGRHERIGELRDLALDDELTGLRNRRGFLTLGPRWLTVDPSKSPMVLLYIDVDGMKQINDRFGHTAGDAALVDVARVLRRTLRKADLIARVGGDEFCALVRTLDDASDSEMIRRLQAAVEVFNRTKSRAYILSLSIGAVAYQPANPCSLDELMARGDELMYRQKTGAAGRPRLLVVDDDPALRSLAHVIFDADCHVSTVATGEECFKAMRERPNLVLLDVRLPDVPGPEIVRMLRADPATLRTPIIMMTGSSERSAEVECLQLGADDYVRKPFDADVLRSRVLGAIRRATGR